MDAVRAHAQPELVLGPEERAPVPPVPTEVSRLARTAALFFRELDGEITRATEGCADLGTLATLGFLGVGALDVSVTGQLPASPWFNMAWWAFRTFVTLEGDAIEEVRRARPAAGSRG